jgi:hypothetical protein
MAQKVQIILEDDLDGGEAEETVTFGLDGSQYEIDLSTKNAEKLRKAMTAYVGAARRVSGKSTRQSKRNGGPAPKDVREWAQQNGYEVPDRGRIPQDVREAYDATH